MNSNLRDKVVLVTGASGGIGHACAAAFAAEGARLALHGNTRRPVVEDFAGTETLVHQADLTDEEQVRGLFEAVWDRFGALDVVLANAGVWPPDATPIQDMTLDRWNATIATNQTSVFLCAREYFRILERERPDNANLVIVGSTAAVFGEEGHAEYAASKAAITYGLTRTLKNEIVRLVANGRVNAVCPGWTKTPMAREELNDPAHVVPVIQTRPLQQIARPEDIANTIIYLASDTLSRHVTGQVITVAGGMEGRLLHNADDVDVTSL